MNDRAGVATADHPLEFHRLDVRAQALGSEPPEFGIVWRIRDEVRGAAVVCDAILPRAVGVLRSYGLVPGSLRLNRPANIARP